MMTMSCHLGIQSVVMTALHDNTLWVNKEKREKKKKRRKVSLCHSAFDINIASTKWNKTGKSFLSFYVATLLLTIRSTDDGNDIHNKCKQHPANIIHMIERSVFNEVELWMNASSNLHKCFHFICMWCLNGFYSAVLRKRSKKKVRKTNA